MNRRLLNGYQTAARLHDLWIILAWTGLLTGMMLNTFFHRSCAGFLANDLTDPCQSFFDVALIFVIAVGAGLTLSDERIAIIGFIFVHLLASAFFVIAVSAPPLYGLNDPVIAQTVLGSSLLTALRYAFPFALFSSFLGSIVGLYLEGKLRLSEARQAPRVQHPVEESRVEPRAGISAILGF